MTKKAITKRILLYELFGFTLIVVFLWLSETADLPHTFFGAPATPVNIVESAYESGMVLAMAIFVLSFTWRQLSHVKYLEGFLPVCSFCKKIRVQDSWIPIDEFIQNNTAAEISHSLCDDCMKAQYNITQKSKDK
ncbi:MAG: hypothetical protein CVV44_14550 [Spirochaetae bacterium HGW-Spirochaetae-1]|jgi:hypothetical protein|nr:MAG: hypothetical protein CVV44_14550 [Spirochaetae bacterium HGW-Spirochaetae-1]